MFGVRDRDRKLLSVDFGHIPSRYRFTLMCPQDRTEHILRARLSELHGEVEEGSELLDVSMGADEPVAKIRRPHGEETFPAQWVIGCDGMHSRVREAAGIAFEGAQYQQGFVLADVTMDWPISREEVSLFFSANGLIVVAPLPEKQFRIVATLDDAPEHPTQELVQQLLHERGPTAPPGRILTCLWTARFRVHHASPRVFAAVGCCCAAMPLTCTVRRAARA
jgi:2-polyprenyl-6-methoxyphenol hydroxylase-like FAD-dependent oxidoreductase